MEKYEVPSMEIVELEGSIVTLKIPGLPDSGHGASGNQNAC
jgi:hypothetical protein